MARFLKINDGTIIDVSLVKGFDIEEDYGLPVLGGSMEIIDGWGGDARWCYYPYVITNKGYFPLCDWLNSKEECEDVIKHTLELVMNDTNSSMINLDEWVQKMLEDRECR